MLSSTSVEVVGAVIVAAALFQVALLLFGAWRRESFERVRRVLELEALGERVAALTQVRILRANQTAATWSGARKFRVLRKDFEGGDICSVYLTPHDGMPIPPYDPGQYLTFLLRLPELEKPLVRCYSLSESPLVTEHYRVSVKRLGPPPKRPELPPGKSSSYFHDVLKEGDIVDVKAPAGHFFLDLSLHTPVVLIGGGVGMTPVLSMLNAICDSGSKRETWFFLGIDNGEQHIMREHLRRLDRENENVHVKICYSRPREEDVEGRDYDHAEWISVDLFKRLLPSNNFDFYICGPPPMMEAITGGLREWGVPDDDIHFEAFGPATVKTAKVEAAAAPDQVPIEIEFARSGKTLNWDPKAASLLDFALDHGIPIDSGCRAGNCGTCVTALRAGEVNYVVEPGSPVEAGSCLACISVPKTNLTLDA